MCLTGGLDTREFDWQPIHRRRTHGSELKALDGGSFVLMRGYHKLLESGRFVAINPGEYFILIIYLLYFFKSFPAPYVYGYVCA